MGQGLLATAADPRRAGFFPEYKEEPINAHDSKLKVLIAADSAEDRETLYSILGCSFELESACNGEEALKLLDSGEGSFGLLILVSSLPCDGAPGLLELFRQVRERANIPVLMAVSETDGEIIDLACAEGVTDFILRPFVNSIVLRRVENALLLHFCKLQSSEMADFISRERKKDEFFSEFFHEVEFEYAADTGVLKLSEYGASHLNLAKRIVKPWENSAVRSVISNEDMNRLIDTLGKTTPKNPTVNIECRLKRNGRGRWYRLVAQTIWSESRPGSFHSIVGKIIDVNDYRTKRKELEHLASRDPLTGLFNKENAKKQIISRMKNEPGAKYALVMLDIDFFKDANDNFGHSFGDETLIHLAKKLTSSIRTGDIVARIGGDEFLIFMQYKAALEPVIKRIYNALVGRFEQFELSISMGVAESEKVGEDYGQLLECADKALYYVKRSGKRHYRFYDDSMEGAFSVPTPIDSDRMHNV